MMVEGKYYLEKDLADNLDKIKNAVFNNNLDAVIVSDGEEGSGKSTITPQLLYYLDRTFNLDRVFFRLDDAFAFIDHCAENNIKHKALMLDESRRFASSDRAMSTDNFLLVTKLSEIRKLNLFIGIILPSFFELNKNIAIHRSRFLVHTYLDKDLKQGGYKVWNRPNKKALYMRGKEKFYSYSWPKPTLHGRFSNWLPYDRAEYEQKARLATLTDRARKGTEPNPGLMLEARRRVFIDMYRGYPKLQYVTHTELARIMGCTQKTMSSWIKSANMCDTPDDGKGVAETLKEEQKVVLGKSEAII